MRPARVVHYKNPVCPACGHNIADHDRHRVDDPEWEEKFPAGQTLVFDCRTCAKMGGEWGECNRVLRQRRPKHRLKKARS